MYKRYIHDDYLHLVDIWKTEQQLNVESTWSQDFISTNYVSLCT